MSDVSCWLTLGAFPGNYLIPAGNSQKEIAVTVSSRHTESKQEPLGEWEVLWRSQPAGQSRDREAQGGPLRLRSPHWQDGHFL